MGADGCKSCCDSKIRTELRKMAFDPDPKRPGCYYEPSIEVRNLALEALNLCPAPEKKDDEIPSKIHGSKEGKGSAEEEGVSEGKGAGSDMDDSIEPKLESPAPDDSEAEDDEADSSAQRSKMLRGRVTEFTQQGYSIRHNNSYHIPAGNLLYISTNSDDGHVVEVVSSNAGMAQVKVVEGRFAGRTSAVNIGVMR